jgi:hypothetical protein
MTFKLRLSLVLISALGLLGTTSAQGLDTTDYFPLHVGDYWTYRADNGVVIETRRVLDTVMIEGKKYYRIAGSFGSGTLHVDSGKVITRVLDEDRVLYKLDAKVGEQWTWILRYDSSRVDTGVNWFGEPLDSVRIKEGPLTGQVFRDVLAYGRNNLHVYDDETYEFLAPGFGLIMKVSYLTNLSVIYGAAMAGRLFGDTTITSVYTPEEVGREDFLLKQNYPNPFNPSTTISYDLPTRSHVTLKIFNLLGQEVATLVNGEVEAGRHQMQWNARGLSSGVYFYRLQAGKFVETRKLILLR